MVIWYGRRLYGKVDEVPGLFHVATQFFYLQYVPLVPLKSFIVLAGSGDERGVPTSMSVKSVLMAWVRTALVGGMLFGLIFGIIQWIEYSSKHAPGSGELLLLAGTSLVGSGLLFWASKRFSRAGYDRAMELATQLELPPELIEQVFTQPVVLDDEATNQADQTWQN